jgi:hypothetical protein
MENVQVVMIIIRNSIFSSLFKYFCNVCEIGSNLSEGQNVEEKCDEGNIRT